MNVFALTAILSPIVGIVAARNAVHPHAGGVKAIASTAGALTGLLIWFLAIGLSVLLTGCSGAAKNNQLRPRQWLGSLAGVLLPMAAPFATYVLIVQFVSRFFPD